MQMMLVRALEGATLYICVTCLITSRLIDTHARDAPTIMDLISQSLYTLSCTHRDTHVDGFAPFPPPGQSHSNDVYFFLSLYSMPWRTLYSSRVSDFPLGGTGQMSSNKLELIPIPSRPLLSTGCNPGCSPT